MSTSEPIQSFLLKKLEEIRARNPSYSLRAFSKKLGLNSGALSGILSGKRKVSIKQVKKLCEKLDVSPEELASITARASTEPVLHYTQIDMDHYRLISDWVHFAILSLVKLDHFKKSPSWISKRLGLPQREVQEALSRLIRMGYLKETTKGRLERTSPNYETSDGVPNLSLRKAHRSNLELASQAIDQLEVGERDFSAITFASSPEKLELAKKMIRKFQDELKFAMEDGPKTEVLKLCVQLFPLTQKDQKETRKK